MYSALNRSRKVLVVGIKVQGIHSYLEIRKNDDMIIQNIPQNLQIKFNPQYSLQFTYDTTTIHLL